MKCVLDSSVAFKWVVKEDLSDKADTLRAGFLAGIHELLAPDVFPPELTHSLTRAERQGRITVGQATILLADVLTTPPQFHASLPLIFRACQISSALRVGAYDCLYVALAERELCTFVTADDKHVKNLKGTFPFIRSQVTPLKRREMSRKAREGVGVSFHTNYKLV
jgi:predicted nucleic acid-binding protein